MSSNKKERDVKSIDRRNFLIAGAAGIAAAGIDVNTALAQPEKAAARGRQGCRGVRPSGGAEPREPHGTRVDPLVYLVVASRSQAGEGEHNGWTEESS